MMNHGPPQPGESNAANIFGLSAPSPINTMPMAADNQNDMMAILDSPMFDSFSNGVPNMFDGMPEMTSGLHQPQSSQNHQFSMPSGASASNIASMNPADTRFSMSAEDSPGPSANTGYGTPSAQNSMQNSTLTEFTKRRNWPAKVVEELKDLLQILDAHGKIRYVSPSVTPLTGYQANDIVDEFLRDLIHPDDVGTFTSEMNEAIATGAPMRMFYRLKKKDGAYAIFESVGHAHIASAKFAPNPDNNTAFCQAVFVMSRPYPTRNASLLDSFLEHKIENERLQRRIAELRREEEEEEASQQSWLAGQEGTTEMTASEDVASSTGAGFYNSNNNNNSGSITNTLNNDNNNNISTNFSNHNGNNSADSQAMPPPERPSPLNLNLTRENLEGATAGARPDSIRDKMARFEGASHTETIEMLTGLRYVEGERSVGITTGNASPNLVKGDAGIAIPVDRDPRTGEKKKKIKVAEEYVCTDCGTLDSPEWRKGPSGPKTLCNACGLRWAKKEKKKGGGGSGSGGPAAMGNGQPMSLVES